MSTTLTGGTFTATLSTSVTINGKDRGCSNLYTVSNVIYHDIRTMQVPTGSEIDVLAFASAGLPLGAGKFLDSSIKYLSIVNKDDANTLRFRLVNTGAEAVDIALPPNGMIVLTSLQFDVSASGGAFGAYVYPDNVMMQATTGAIDIEYEIVIG